jgi:Zn-dependent M28 family amino/carboxypeptidase
MRNGATIKSFSLRRMAIMAAAVCLAACAQRAELLPADVQAAAKASITPATLAAPIRFLADDHLGGRGVASTGDELARLYLGTQLQLMGYQPGAADGGWYQPVPLVGVTTHRPKTWEFRAPSGHVSLKDYDDFIAYTGVQQASAGFKDAEVVFVGYGIQAPEYQWDDYKGMDVKGKVLLMMNNDPDWDPKLFAGTTRLYYGRWDYKYEQAARLGAAGAIIIHTRPSAGYPFQVVQTSWTGEQFELPDEGEPRTQVRSWVTEQAAQQLARAGGFDLAKLIESARQRDFRPVSLGLTTSLTVQNTVRQVQSANVLGVLPGSDPRLRDEYVVYTAHHDHLGIGVADQSGDTIYNGALDNASGCAQVLAIARALAALPTRPRRSTLVLFVAAEEQNLLGARYYARHPTVAPGRIAANINYDGGSIWGRTRDITVIGYGKSSLDAVLDSVAGFQQRTVKADDFPDRGHFYRSDQFAFAKIGVPAVHPDNGTDFIGQPSGWGKLQIEAFEDQRYHQPSDQLDASWNFDGMVDDAQMGFYAGWLVSNADAMPHWNAGDEFEATRQAALQAVPAAAH